MSSQLYSKPTRTRTQKLVLALLAVIILLIVALVFVWLKPGSGSAPAAAGPASSAPAIPTSGPSTAAATTGTTAVVPTNGSAQWTIPVPGDGGPSTKSAAGVPRGYDASDSGAVKAAINGVVAARWMKFRIENPADGLAELAVTDGEKRAAVVKQLVPTESLNIDTGKKEAEPTPAGGKVLGAQLVQRDAQKAKVLVLWEEFDVASKGTVGVSMEPMGIELQWVDNDWLLSGVGTFPLDMGNPTKVVGEIGRVQDWVPVPSEGWYW